MAEREGWSTLGTRHEEELRGMSPEVLSPGARDDSPICRVKGQGVRTSHKIADTFQCHKIADTDAIKSPMP